MQKQTLNRELAKCYPEYFSGNAFVQQLAETDIDVSMVYFEAGARTKPHTHSHDQVLCIEQGQGLVVTETETLAVGAGDVVLIPAGVWHWHGATDTSPMAHLAITQTGLSNFDVPAQIDR